MRSEGDARRGLYKKYIVYREDETDLIGGRHSRCKYFVLDLTHDQFAGPALEAYARACRKDFPLLASDLGKLVRGDKRPLLKLRPGGK